MTTPIVPQAPGVDRATLLRRGLWLNAATMAYNAAEGVIAIVAGRLAGSVALVGFGVDSAIELGAGVTALWRLRADLDLDRRATVERKALRLVGWSFLALAAYIVYDAVDALVRREAPSQSTVGIALAALSLVVMPLLARAKRRVARAMGSSALGAEAAQTDICAWLSAILLGGLGLNAVVGWWWADPVAALAMVPLIVREGWQGLRGRAPCGDGCATP